MKCFLAIQLLLLFSVVGTHGNYAGLSGSSRRSEGEEGTVDCLPPLRTRARAAATASQARRTGATTLARHHAMTRVPICCGRCRRRLPGCRASPAPPHGSAGRRGRPRRAVVEAGRCRLARSPPLALAFASRSRSLPMYSPSLLTLLCQQSVLYGLEHSTSYLNHLWL
jgi:hypothetical protein